MSEYKVSQTIGQAVVQNKAAANIAGASGNYLLKRQVQANLAGLAGNYLRDARILDMSKPLHVAELVGQILTRVVVPANLSDVSVIVMQNQTDRVIPPVAGGLFQTCIY